MEGYWDIHNHILPGIDDGSSCDEETFDMIAQEYEQGVRYIIFTPHYRKGMFEISEKDRMETYSRIVEKYRKQYAGQMPGMEFALGCELHIHPSQFSKAYRDIYRMPGDAVVLVEFSGKDDYDSIAEALGTLTAKGFTCIIAHAERYSLSPEDISRLSEMDQVYIQINAGSILGDEGWMRKRFARTLLKEKLVDFIGSDAHDTRSRKVNIGRCAEWIVQQYGEEYAGQLLIDNPASLFLEE